MLIFKWRGSCGCCVNRYFGWVYVDDDCVIGVYEGFDSFMGWCRVEWDG